MYIDASLYIKTFIYRRAYIYIYIYIYREREREARTSIYSDAPYNYIGARTSIYTRAPI